MKPGNVVTLTALAQGMLLCSGNDAANAAAMAIAGSTEEFAKLMNQRAKQIGMKNTNFVTPDVYKRQGYSLAYVVVTTAFSLILAALVVGKHHANIGRILRGEEKKITAKKRKN